MIEKRARHQRTAGPGAQVGCKPGQAAGPEMSGGFGGLEFRSAAARDGYTSAPDRPAAVLSVPFARFDR